MCPISPPAPPDRRTTLPQAFARQAARQPDATALIQTQTDPRAPMHEISFSEADRLIDRIAAALVAMGLQRGDRVAVRLEKSASLLLLFFAVLRAGGIYVPINPAFTARETDVLIAESAPALLIDNAPEAAEPSHDPRLGRCGFLRGGGDDLFDAAMTIATAEIPAANMPRPDDIAAMLFTSGTTGRPKGAPLTHANLLSNMEALGASWRIGPGDRILHVLPVFHAHGLFIAAAMPLIRGATLVITTRFDPVQTVALLPDATVLMAVPAIYTRLLGDAGFGPEACRRIRLLTAGSAPLSPDVFATLRKRTGLSVVERYGLTETSILTTNPIDGTARAGSVGQPLANVELRVVDAEGRALGPDQIGRIEARGPAIISAYWHRPDCAGEWTKDGFFNTGDVGRIDAGGFVWLVGRQKDLIISGGYNVYPREVEIVIETVPGVQEAVVFGVPHPDFGEGVVAAVAIEAGAQVDEDAISHAVARDLTRYKQPKKIVFMDDFPRNSLGKVLKTELRRLFAGAFEPGSRG